MKKIIRRYCKKNRAKEDLWQNAITAALYQTALGLLNRLDMNELLTRIVISAAGLIGTEHGYVNLVDLKQGTMVRKVGIGAYQQDVSRVMGLQQGMIRRVLETGRVVVVDDYSRVSDRLQDSFFDQFHSEMQVPLSIDRQIVGVLGMSFTERGCKFRQKDIELFNQFAVIASIALDNARLYEISRHEIAQHRETQAQLQRIAMNMHDIVVQIDKTGHLQYVSASCKKVIGYTDSELQGEAFSRFVHPEERERARATYQAFMLTGEPSLACYRYRHADGRYIWLESMSEKFYDDQGQLMGAVVVARDVTDRKQAEESAKAARERAHHLERFDTLTGLPNRASFEERLNLSLVHAKRSGERLAVLFVDLDRFKLINDTLGHHAGDSLLQQVAQRLRLLIHNEDIVCRQGGDEFIMLFTDIYKLLNMSQIISRITQSLIEPYYLEGKELRITPSIGISIYPDNGHSAEALIKNAELAMYYAKENGRNNFQFFTESLNKSVAERMTLENSLRSALARKEFVLYYQPQINIQTHTVVGAEALIRWRHPEQGMIPPGRFIPVAEETGLIIPLGEWVIREACRQHAAWLEEGLPPIPVAINISAAQFQQKRFPELLESIIKEYPVDPRCLELELTEGMVMKDAEATIKELYKLRELGIRLAIDDFGIGYSSFSYLCRFPINKLKIDRSFIVSMNDNHARMAVVEAIIMLAKKLGITVIAEGVENRADLDVLRNCQCDEVQGYYYARPLAPDDFIHWLRQWKNT